MGIFDPTSPSTLFKPWLPSTLSLTNLVTVVPDLSVSRKWVISWVAQPAAVKYIVYASPCPTNKNKFQEVSRLKTSVEFVIPVSVPDDYTFYFWVGMETPSGSIAMLQTEPVFTSIDTAFETNPLSRATERDIIYNADSKFFVEEMRRRHLAMLEYDGEDFYLFIRRSFGQPCVCQEIKPDGTISRVTPVSTDDYTQLGQEFNPDVAPPQEDSEAKNPEYQSSYRCQYCYGTAIIGGYFPKIRIRVRYGNMPRRTYSMEEQGIEFAHNFTSWTIWHPKLKEQDFLVRIRTGERFLITDVGQSELRGIALHQEFNTIVAPRTAIIYNVTDAGIMDGLAKESTWDLARFDWAIWS